MGHCLAEAVRAIRVVAVNRRKSDGYGTPENHRPVLPMAATPVSARPGPDMVPGGSPVNGEQHYALPVHEVVLLLGVDPEVGLGDGEVGRRRERFGPNRLPESRTSGPMLRILRQLHHPLVYVLLAAAAVTLALGEYVDSAVILGVVLINTVVGFIQ